MPAVIFQGSKVKTLKDALQLKDSATIYAGANNPTVTPTFGAVGDLYISTDANSFIYQKRGSEATDTDWAKISVLTSLDNDQPNSTVQGDVTNNNAGGQYSLAGGIQTSAAAVSTVALNYRTNAQHDSSLTTGSLAISQMHNSVTLGGGRSPGWATMGAAQSIKCVLRSYGTGEQTMETDVNDTYQAELDLFDFGANGEYQTWYMRIQIVAFESATQEQAAFMLECLVQRTKTGGVMVVTPKTAFPALADFTSAGAINANLWQASVIAPTDRLVRVTMDDNGTGSTITATAIVEIAQLLSN